MPINTRFFGSPLQTTWLAFITASLLIVLVSSANAANLLLARSVLRAREIAIRASLGAGRGRIVAQLLVESLVLAVLGGAVGLGVSVGGVRIFTSVIPESATPYWLDYSMDATVFAALVGMSFLTVAIFGLVPALQASKSDVNRVLKEGGRSATTRARRWTFAFLAAEIALTVVLLAQALVSVQNDGNDLASDAQVITTEILTASVALPRPRYATAQQRNDFYVHAVERLAAIPGVTAAAVATSLPRHGSLRQSLDVEGVVRAPGEQGPAVSTLRISPGYFDALRVPIRSGRAFDGSDGSSGREHVIVNQRFAETYFPGAQPLGRRIRVAMPNAPAGEATWHTIVGVAADVRQQSIPGAEPVVYLPVAGAPPPAASLLLRSTLDTSGLAVALREAAAEIDPQPSALSRAHDAASHRRSAVGGSPVLSIDQLADRDRARAVDRGTLCRRDVHGRTTDAGDRRPDGARRAGRGHSWTGPSRRVSAGRGWPHPWNRGNRSIQCGLLQRAAHGR